MFSITTAPKVSILVPIYKVPEKYLRACIESLINQTLKDIEIVLVDDGSPDDCGKICDEYALQDERIKVIHQPNEGLAAARNNAFDNATGEYITFLDGDDYLELNACEVSYNVAKEKQVQLVFWNQYSEFSHTTEIKKTFDDEEREFRGEDCKQLQARVLNFNGNISQVFSKLIERDFLKKHSIRHIKELSQGAEGFVFNIQLFEHLQSAYYLPQPLLHYVYNSNSISHTHNETNHYMVLRCFEYIEKYIQNSKNSELLQKSLYNRMLYVIITTAITGYFSDTNNVPYREKVKGFKKYIQQDILQRSLKSATRQGLSFQRRVTLKLIELKQYRLIAFLAKARKKQLKNK